jgi:hypothetical protein
VVAACVMTDCYDYNKQYNMYNWGWRNDLLDKRFTSVDPEIGIRRVATNKDKDKLQKLFF